MKPQDAHKFTRSAASDETLSDWAAFLADTPPNVPRVFSGLVCGKMGGMHGTQLQRYLPMPDVDMHCTREGAVRRFARGRELWIHAPDSSVEPFKFLTYQCRNCGNSEKTIAIVLDVKSEERGDVEIMKLGEYPPFAAPIPKELRALLGESASLFEKGWHSERGGFGIGAAGYYRRVVELSWRTLLLAMKSAAVAIEAPPDVLARFDQASKETQFSRAVDSIKDAFPERLYIFSGVNPLTLLYGSLSTDIHARSDAECLEVAGATRKVLQAMVETIARAQREHETLKEAVKKLRS